LDGAIGGWLLELIFEAVLNGEKEVARVLRATPEAYRQRASRDILVEAIPHWLYLGARTDCRLRARGSTPLQLAALSTGASGTAGTLDLQIEIIGLLRQYGADATAVDGANRTPYDWARSERVSKALNVRQSPRSQP
jgi:hypothetical protein